LPKAVVAQNQAQFAQIMVLCIITRFFVQLDAQRTSYHDNDILMQEDSDGEAKVCAG
jgi:hypothetical protein